MARFFNPLNTPSSWIAIPHEVSSEKVKIILNGVLKSGITEMEIKDGAVHFTLKFTNTRENLLKKLNGFAKFMTISSGCYIILYFLKLLLLIVFIPFYSSISPEA